MQFQLINDSYFEMNEIAQIIEKKNQGVRNEISHIGNLNSPVDIPDRTYKCML